MPAEITDLIVHPAGRDHPLRLAMDDLKLDRWLSTSTLLHATGTDWQLRTSRSQALAASAVRSAAIPSWRKEHPDSPDASMMWARLFTQRALAEGRRNVRRDVLDRLVQFARDACADASWRWPADPVPYICRLALAQFDVDQQWPQYREHWAKSPDPLLPIGPWPLLHEVNLRDPGNREAYHRMLQYWYARGASASDFAQYVASQAPTGSVLSTLPLYAFAHTFRLVRDQMISHTAGLFGFWPSAQVVHYTRQAMNSWFAYIGKPDLHRVSVLDLNHLAFAMSRGGMRGAGMVFEAIGPYATPAPWRDLSEAPDRWEEQFQRARAAALNANPHA